MTKAIEMLRKLTTLRRHGPQVETAFDLRLRQLGGAPQPGAARAVLFKTRPEPQEA